MPIEFACSKCGKTLRVKDELAGKAARCACGEITKIPDNSTVSKAEKGDTATAKVPSAKNVESKSTNVETTNPAKSIVATKPKLARAPVAAPSASIFDELTSNDWERGSNTTAVNPYKIDRSGPSEGQFLKQFTKVDISQIEEATRKHPQGLIGLVVLHFFLGTMCLVATTLVIVLAGLVARAVNAVPMIAALGMTAVIAGLFTVTAMHFFVAIGYLKKFWIAWCTGVTLYSYNMINVGFDAFHRYKNGADITQLIIGVVVGILINIIMLNLMKQDGMLKYFGLSKNGTVPYWVSFLIGASLATIIGFISVANYQPIVVPADPPPVN